MSKIVKQAARSTVLIHKSINIANSNGVLCEHPLKEQPSQTTLNTIITILPKYFILFMSNSQILALTQVE